MRLKILHIILSSCCRVFVVNYIHNLNVFFVVIERDLGNTNNSCSLKIFTIVVKEPTVNLLTMSKRATKARRHCCGVANTMEILELICAALL